MPIQNSKCRYCFYDNEVIDYLCYCEDRVAIEFYNLLEGFQGNKVPVVMVEHITKE